MGKGRPGGGPENLLPPFGPGNQAAKGNHTPKKIVRPWDKVFVEMFEMIKNNPEELEKKIGMKIPEGIRKKDAQMLLVMLRLQKAMKGDSAASSEIMNRMDGAPKQKVEQEVTGQVVQIIKFSDVKSEVEK